jgi:hypothetical protein
MKEQPIYLCITPKEVRIFPTGVYISNIFGYEDLYFLIEDGKLKKSNKEKSEKVHSRCY